jgi:hypothetical protein
MSEKYREIEVQIDPAFINRKSFVVFPNAEYKDVQDGYIVAILKIPVEEKKVTITESMLDEALKYADKEYDGNSINSWTKCFKQKLFSKERE